MLEVKVGVNVGVVGGGSCGDQGGFCVHLGLHDRASSHAISWHMRLVRQGAHGALQLGEHAVGGEVIREELFDQLESEGQHTENQRPREGGLKGAGWGEEGAKGVGSRGEGWDRGG